MDRSLDSAPRRGDEPDEPDGFVRHDEPRIVPSPNGALPDTLPAPGAPSSRRGYGHAPPGERGLVLRVSARSRPSAVAGAIAGEVRGQGRVEVQAMGADAVNQAIKAIALARDYLRESGIEAVCLPRLVGIDFDGDARTAVTLVVEAR